MIRIRDSVRIPGKVQATWWLLIINVLSFFAATSMGRDVVFLAGGVIPADFANPDLVNQMLMERIPDFDPEKRGRAPGIITIFWAMFLHADLVHLLGNGLALFIFGPNVEAYMGRTRFLLFYFSCGAFGFMTEILFGLNSVIPIIGASGATSGLFGAYFILFSDHYIRITIGKSYQSYYRDIPLPIKALIIIWLASQIFYSLFSPIAGPTGVAYLTHLGGFVCGYFIAKGKGQSPRRPNFRVYRGGQAG